LNSYITVGTAATRIGPPISGTAPELGDTIKFIPHALKNYKAGGGGFGQDLCPVYGPVVTGTCVFVNSKGHWARFEYEQPGSGIAWECFKY